MTYAAMKPGDKVSFGHPNYRIVKSVSKPYDVTNSHGEVIELVDITCTDGYAVTVMAGLDAR